LLLGTALGFEANRRLRYSWPSGPPPWETGIDAFWPATAVLVTLLLVIGGAGLAALRAVPTSEIAPLLGVQGVGVREARWHRILVGGQFAASVVVLAGAGLLLRSTTAPGETKLAPGFDPRDTLLVRVELPAGSAETERRETYRSVLREIRSLPEVVAAGVGGPGASLGLGPTDRVHALIVAAGDPGVVKTAQLNVISDGFLEAVGHASLPDEVFRESNAEVSDTEATYDAVVNTTFAYSVFHTRDPVGKSAQLGGISMTRPWYTVAGVVDDLRAPGIGSVATPGPAIYVSAFQHPPVSAEFAIRAGGDPLRLLPPVRESMHRVEPEMRIVDVMTYEQRLARYRAPLGWFGGLFAIVSGLALCLALSGLFATTAQAVVRREREIGTHRAVGATARSILTMILVEAGELAAAGAVLGLFSALCLGRVLQVLFYGVRLWDPMLYAAVAGLLSAVTLAGAYSPARRAARMAPAAALRAE
jgi:putative ABC transport system permease protein